MKRFVASFSLLVFLFSALPLVSQSDGSVMVAISTLDQWIAALKNCKSELEGLKSDNKSLIANLTAALSYLTEAREHFQTARTMQYDNYLGWSELVMDWTTRYEALKMQSEAEIHRLKTQIKWLKIGCVTLAATTVTGLILYLVELSK